jgi:hypothetical protein
MNTKIISNRALSIIDQYKNFKVGNASCSVPYFNNKTRKTRAGLRVSIGKGSPKEIFDEAQDLIIKNHLEINTLTNDSLKGLLVDNNIGIDCSAFVYYILNAENKERNKGHIDRHLSFISCHGIFGKIRCSFRPVENCDVATFAHDKNSRTISIKKAEPGDIITISGIPLTNISESLETIRLEKSDRDHILVIHEIEYQNFIPTIIRYSHAIAYPEDGKYDSGIRHGEIQIAYPEKSIVEQRWIENNKEGEMNRLFIRTRKSKTEIRRLKWF